MSADAGSGEGGPAPIILTATMGGEDAAWATALRTAHFPPERNFLRAHITLFHHLPGPQWPLVKDVVKRLCAENPPPVARIDRLINLGRGVAFHVGSPDLLDLRADLADAFFGLLTPQDSNKPRLHITVQNKVEPSVARKLLQTLESDFTPRSLSVVGIEAHYYRGGPWEPIQAWKFRG